MWLLKERKTEFITVADEEAASRMLREYHNGPDTRLPGHDGSPERREKPPEPTADAVFVEKCLLVARQNRIRDPFRVAQRVKGWTRTQWDDAHLEYELAQKRRWLQHEHTDVIGETFASLDSSIF